MNLSALVNASVIGLLVAYVSAVFIPPRHVTLATFLLIWSLVSLCLYRVGLGAMFDALAGEGGP
jgi:hypothetical protein